MKYPALKINLKKLHSNVETIVKLCKEKNISVAAVTKAFCGNPQIAKVFVDGGVDYLADSRIENLKKYANFNIHKILLRIPMISQATDVVTYSDISLNSEVSTIKELSKAALLLKKIHKVIIMIDLGDLREGILPIHIEDFVKKIVTLEGIKLVGIGVNLNCYGGVIPTYSTLKNLVNIGKKLETTFNLNLDIISGGNSGSLNLLLEDNIPTGLNNLRIGEGILLGVETSFQNLIPDTYNDVFTFCAEIIELKDKPSVPIGTIGLNAFGKQPIFEDKGIMTRGILACGIQDISLEQITPKDTSIELIGASSDHMIVDLTKTNIKYKVGDILEFNVSYGSILSASTSEYVQIEFY